jgi:hypothetical protein
MNIYDAIMAAADHIEAHPKLFDYQETTVPGCGSKGCAVGWIAYFQRVKQAFDLDELCQSAIGVRYWNDFVPRMDSLEKREDYWRVNAASCARTLRAYAGKYHAPAKPHLTGLPAHSARDLR